MPFQSRSQKTLEKQSRPIRFPLLIILYILNQKREEITITAERQAKRYSELDKLGAGPGRGVQGEDFTRKKEKNDEAVLPPIRSIP